MRLDRAYLLFSRGILNYVIHQDRKQLRYSMDTSGVCPILCRAIDRLAMLFRQIDPFASYGIYDIEYSQFMSCWSLLEVSVDLLDKYRLGLHEEILVSRETTDFDTMS